MIRLSYATKNEGSSEGSSTQHYQHLPNKVATGCENNQTSPCFAGAKYNRI